MYLVGAALIIAAARGDLWMDEVWSIWIARTVKDAGEILRLHFDNNHVLNTLFQYWVQGQHHSPWIYRLPAIAAGIGSLLLIGVIARREWGEWEALCAVALSGFSYPLVLYFSEARGYAPVMFFALAAYYALRGNLEEPGRRRLGAFWAANALGILSHLTFVFVFAANFAMHFARTVRDVADRRARMASFLAHQVPASVFVAGWTFYFRHDMEIGGGPASEKFAVAGEAAALLVGLPQTAAAYPAGLLIVIGVILTGLVLLLRERNPAWVFFGALLLVCPLFLFLVLRPETFYFRYFIVCFPFFYLLLAHVLCVLAGMRSRVWRLLVAATVCGMLAGQALRIYPLLELGRGSYLAAVAQILQQSPQAVIRVGSDHDLRNQMLVNFYAPLLSGGDRVRYVEGSRWPMEPPDWLLTHSQDTSHRPPASLGAPPALLYELVGEYRYSGISGWNWYLFRRIDQRPPPSSQNATPIAAVTAIAKP